MGEACPSPLNLRPVVLKGFQLKLTYEDPAIDSGLKAVALLKWHSLFARNTAPAANFEGSILLCNEYRHAAASARFVSGIYKMISLG